MKRLVALLVGLWLVVPSAQTLPRSRPAIAGFTAAAEVARAYDTILNADFSDLDEQLAATCGPAPPEVCHLLEARALWWAIALEPESRSRDVPFSRAIADAIAGAEAWTRRESERAEAWFYLGAAQATRIQWHLLRQERLAAVRDGQRTRDAFNRALSLDPNLHDAKFGVGLYRYYAEVAPAAFKMPRWATQLPGGNRIGGLRQLTDARDRGETVRSEADYQLHSIYLWYEKRPREALTLVQGLQTRHPRNPLFYQLEAEIHDVQFQNPTASLDASTRLLASADAKSVNEPRMTSVRARLNMAQQLSRLGNRQRAINLLNEVIAERPSRPQGAIVRAQQLLKTIRTRTKR